jgi:hypothetical protein
MSSSVRLAETTVTAHHPSLDDLLQEQCWKAGIADPQRRGREDKVGRVAEQQDMLREASCAISGRRRAEVSCAHAPVRGTSIS